jgi:hypothetical protein
MTIPFLGSRRTITSPTDGSLRTLTVVAFDPAPPAVAGAGGGDDERLLPPEHADNAHANASAAASPADRFGGEALTEALIT